MTGYARRGNKKESTRRTLAIDRDRTDGFKSNYYGREGVYASNHATEGQSHE